MKTHALLTAAAGGAAFAGAGLFSSPSLLTLARLVVLGAALAAAALYDLAQRRIPNRLVIPAAGVCAALTLAAGAPLSLLAGLALVMHLLTVSLCWPSALGMGDVKLALLLVLGLDGSALRALAIGLAFAALAGCALLARQGRTAWRASLPLAPFIAAGALLAVIRMSDGSRMGRRLAAVSAAAGLVLGLALAWDIRPALPPLPNSFSAPLPTDTISAALDLAAWIAFVLLDLGLVWKVLQFATRREPTRIEIQLRRAFATHDNSSIERPGDWRAHAAPLAPPVLRLPSRHEAGREPTHVRPQLQALLETHATPVEPVADDVCDKRIGVRLLGPLELSGCRKKRPRRQATAELIAYLALQPRRASRDELLEALWPGDDPRRSADRFYQAASEARKLLGDAFRRDRDTYTLDGQGVWTDLDELDRLRAEAEAATGEHKQMLLERALALFRGQPLAGLDALWAETEARRLCSLHVELLERVGRLRLQAGDATKALEVAQRAQLLDSSNERPTQLAMEAEAALGRREAVVERYERLCRELDERFGLEPSRDTKVLYRRLLSQDAA
jgi:DNA-binding SARP family transcriptional activator/Flp pilus assembly protein protease CpaA